MFFNFPILHVTAESTNIQDTKQAGSKKTDKNDREKNYYSCPVYKYPKRNDRYLIFRPWLKADGAPGSLKLSSGVTAPQNWKLKGVALLCCKE
jgi:dynein heavy chain